MTIKQSKTPAIPSVPHDAPPELSMFLNAVKSALDVVVGDTSASGVTIEQLNEILREYTITGGSAFGGIGIPPSVTPGAPPVEPPDTTTPPPPSGLTATGSLSTVILEWDPLPSSPPIAFTTIYRAAVDNFSLAEAVGTSNVLLYSDFVPDIDPYYYWIRFTSEAGIEGPVNAAGGVLGQSDPDATGKIVVSSLSALAANMGTLRAGELLSPDSTFHIDLTNKEILITGPNGQAADDYTVIRNGIIEAYQWTGTGHELAKALRGLATGIASNGARVTIPGYFRNQPRIIVSPANLPSFLSAFQAQDQTLQCIALNIAETIVGSGSWEFDAVAQLVIAGGSELQTPGLSFSDSQINDQYLSSVTTTSSSVTTLQVGTSVRTYRSNGTAGVYFNRQVTVSLEYRPAPFTGAWTVGDTKVQQINQETSYVLINLDTGAIAADQYEVRLRYVFADTGGTYNGAGGSLIPQPDVTRTAPDVNEYHEIISQDSALNPSGTASLQAWTPPAGAANISTRYQYNWTANAFAAHRGTSGSTSSRVRTIGDFLKQRASAVDNTNNGLPVEQNANGSEDFSQAGYDANLLGWNMALATDGPSDSTGTITMTSITATISYSIPATTDTNPHNFAVWNTLNATLSGSTVLSDGTVNWQAIGES